MPNLQRLIPILSHALHRGNIETLQLLRKPKLDGWHKQLFIVAPKSFAAPADRQIFT
jgi:hypothetical protein